MGNDSQKNELQVEQYDAVAAEMKRKKILKRVGIGAGIAAVLVVLGYFGLTAMQNMFMTVYYVGGNGAWFNSQVIFLEDENG